MAPLLRPAPTDPSPPPFIFFQLVARLDPRPERNFISPATFQGLSIATRDNESGGGEGEEGQGEADRTQI